MATENIKSSGLFRSAYRVKIGQGAADQAKAGLTEQSLRALVNKAKSQWGQQVEFEFRLVEKRGSTYLEILRHKNSTRAKDNDARYSGDRAQPQLLQRDERRLRAVELLSRRFDLGNGLHPGVAEASGIDARARYGVYDLAGQRAIGHEVRVSHLRETPRAAFSISEHRSAAVKSFARLLDLELAVRAGAQLQSLRPQIKPDAQAQVPSNPARKAEVAQAPAQPKGPPEPPPVRPPADNPAHAAAILRDGAERASPAQAKPQPGPSEPEDPFADLALMDLADGPTDDRTAQVNAAFNKRLQANVSTTHLAESSNRAAERFKQLLESPAQPHQADRVQLADGSSALRITRQAAKDDGLAQTEYFNFEKLQKFNRKEPYQHPALARHQASIEKLMGDVGLSWQAASQHSKQLAAAEKSLRKDAAAQVQAGPGSTGIGDLWTGPKIQQALSSVSQGVREELNRRVAGIANALRDKPELKDQHSAKLTAQALMVDIVAAEHLMSVTHRADDRQKLSVLHQDLTAQLCAFIRVGAPSGQADLEATLTALDEHFKEAREKATKRGQAGELQNFPTDFARKANRSKDDAQARLKEAQERQKALVDLKAMPQKHRVKLEEARQMIQARADVQLELRRGEGPQVRSVKAPPLNPLHKTEVPPRRLSDSPEWQELCNYVTAVNQLREAGRTGFEAYRDQKDRVPDHIVAEKFAMPAEYDPLVAVKITSTMRQLMESLTPTSADKPVQVYMPKSGGWVQWALKDIGDVNGKAPLVAMAQLIELEFMIAHGAAANPFTAQQLTTLHKEVSESLLKVIGIEQSNPDQRAKDIREWVKGTKRRVDDLSVKIAQNQRREDPLLAATLSRAVDLTMQAYDEITATRQRRAERAAEQDLSEAQADLRSRGEMVRGFAPRSVDDGLQALLSEESENRVVAVSTIKALITGPQADPPVDRDALAGRLAQTLSKATDDQLKVLPAALRALAAFAPGPEGKAWAAREGQRLRMAVATMGDVHSISQNENLDPVTMLNSARELTLPELQQSLKAAVDDRRLVVKDFPYIEGQLVRTDDQVRELGRQFAQQARDHFKNPDESRPFAGLMLVRGGGHWVSVVAERQANGQLACVAVDTDDRGGDTTNWIRLVGEALNQPAGPDEPGHGSAVGQPIKLDRATAGLQNEGATNGCGPLQLRFLKSLQLRKPDASVLKHAKGWTKDGELASDVKGKTWQVFGERADAFGATFDAAQIKLREHRRIADRSYEWLTDKVRYTIERAEEALQPRGPQESPDQRLARQVDAVGALKDLETATRDYANVLAELKLTNDQGELISPLDGRDEIPVAKLSIGQTLLQITEIEGERARGLEMIVDFQREAENTRSEFLMRMLGQVRKELREAGIDLLETHQLATERSNRERWTKAVAEPTNQKIGDQLPALLKELLPGFEWADGDFEPDQLKTYLSQYPQRLENAAVLAQAATRLARLNDDDPITEEAWKQRAHTIWSELAEHPFSSSDLLSRAQQQQAAVVPSREPLEIRNDEGDVAMEMEANPAQLREKVARLKQTLADELKQSGLLDRVRVAPSASVARTESSQALAGSARMSSAELDTLRAARNSMLGVGNLIPKACAAREKELMGLLFKQPQITLGQSKGINLIPADLKKPEVLYRLAELVMVRNTRKGVKEVDQSAKALYLQLLKPALDALEQQPRAQRGDGSNRDHRLQEAATLIIAALAPVSKQYTL